MTVELHSRQRHELAHKASQVSGGSAMMSPVTYLNEGGTHASSKKAAEEFVIRMLARMEPRGAYQFSLAYQRELWLR